MTRDIGQCLLKNPIALNSALRGKLRLDALHRERRSHAVSGTKPLQRILDGRDESHRVKNPRPQFVRYLARRIDGLLDQRDQVVTDRPDLILLRRFGTAKDPGHIHLDRSKHAAKDIVHLTSEHGPLLLSQRVDVAGQFAQLLSRPAQLLFTLHALGDLDSDAAQGGLSSALDPKGMQFQMYYVPIAMETFSDVVNCRHFARDAEPIIAHDFVDRIRRDDVHHAGADKLVSTVAKHCGKRVVRVHKPLVEDDVNACEGLLDDCTEWNIAERDFLVCPCRDRRCRKRIGTGHSH